MFTCKLDSSYLFPGILVFCAISFESSMILIRVNNQKKTISHKVRGKHPSKVKHPCKDK